MYNSFGVLMVCTSTGDVLKMSEELKDIQGVVNQTSQVSTIKLQITQHYHITPTDH